MNKNEVLDKSHLEESSNLARQYFKELGLDYSVIKLSDLYKLREFIIDRINILLADSTYSMVKELCMDRKIDVKFDKSTGILEEAYLYTNGSYFTKRQAVSFERVASRGKEFIGFCGWASGCNRIPFIEGFINWCDYMASQIKLKDTSAMPSR